MGLHLYNTLTRKKEPFSPIEQGRVRMYVCGPTVYDDPHIGHARSAFVFDILRRYLEFSGFAVDFARNVTDVDDKIIDRARKDLGEKRKSKEEAGVLKDKCREVSSLYLERYHSTLELLGIKSPTYEPKATSHVVPDMTDFISKLLMQGVAYESGGDVYFSVRKFESYGRLSNRSLDELLSGARVEPGENKRDPLDFAVWKAAKPGEPSWRSPWGEGRPGWHIECSAMSTKYLGDEFDIHGGGLDLIFPHHENEIAQAQAAGKAFARYWVHNGLLTVNGEKMSKSLGNFIMVTSALESCSGNVDVLKTFFLGTHYRSPLDYTDENIAASESRLIRWIYLLNFAECIREKFSDSIEISDGRLEKLKQAFESAMNDDLNTPAALAALDNLAAIGYQELEKSAILFNPTDNAARANLLAVSGIIKNLGGVLGLFAACDRFKIPEEIYALVKEREEARKNRHFERADAVRGIVESQGFIIADTAGGAIVLPKP